MDASQQQQYNIPRLLDAPPKAFYWDVDEFMATLAPIGIGMILEWFFAGVILGVVLGYSISKLKAGRGAYYMVHWLYWTLNIGSKRVTPPSFIREFIG
jgi:type IV conjugative transfer system protein TraL